MSERQSIFLPAFGKVVELGRLDDFVWATVNGWTTLPATKLLRRSAKPIDPGGDPERQADELARRLKAEEEDLRLHRFTEEEADKRYPYLFSLVAVRLWAMIEAAVREFLVHALLDPRSLPKTSALEKLRGPISPFIGADASVQAELLADMVLELSEGRLHGVRRYDAALEKIGFEGRPPGTIDEILRELAEVRHCVVHRGGKADKRLLSACPWLQAAPGDALPATIERFWLYRTATYWYFMELVRRWSAWKNLNAPLHVATHMQLVVLDELAPAWDRDKRQGNLGTDVSRGDGA